MRRLFVAIALVGTLTITVSVSAQQTPAPTAATYAALADAILSLNQAEHALVLSMLDVHYQAARAELEAGRYNRAAAQMALFANEGDNVIAGVRKRLLEGGHHHHAKGETQGLYEPGYVIVTIAAKETMMAATAAIRQASSAAQARDAWRAFDAAASPLLAE